jgi:hypothetical protein
MLNFEDVRESECIDLLVLGIDVYIDLENVGSSTSHNPMGLHGLLNE